MRVLGIDPGLDGGLALIHDSGLDLHVMPTEGNGKKGGRQVDRKGLLALLGALAPDVAHLEQVHSMPRDGVRQSWSFATSTESVHMGLVALNIPLVLVRPQEWQGEVCKGMPKGDPKSAALVVARRLWPSQDWLATARSKKPHQGIVDAALIACYGRLRSRG